MKYFSFQARGDGVSSTSPVEIQVFEFSRGQRIKKTLLWFGIFLGLGAFSALIPVVHFISVPLFAILALGSLIFVPMNRDEIIKAETTCPYCGKVTQLQRPSVNVPFHDSCQHCHQILLIEGPRAGT